MQVRSANNVTSSWSGLPTIVGSSASFAWQDPLSGTVAVWHLDDTGEDVLGPSDLTLPAGASWVQGHTPAASDHAAHFDSNTCMSTTTMVDLGDNPPATYFAGMTMLAWINPDPTTCTGKHAIAMRGWEFSLWLDCDAVPGERKLSAYALTSTGGHWTTPAGNIVPGQWTHVAVTWDKAHARTFVAGTWLGENTLDGDSRQTSNWVSISGRPDLTGYGFQGAIDEVSIFRNGMGADEIALHALNRTNYKTSPVYSSQWARIEDGFFNVITAPGDPGYLGSGVALQVNDAGVIVGYQALTSGGNTAMMFSPTTGWTNLNEWLADHLGAANNWDLQVAYGIDQSSRYVVGEGLYYGRRAPFRLDLVEGDIKDLGYFTDYPYTDPSTIAITYSPARAVNSRGDVAGFIGYWNLGADHGFIYTDGIGLVDLNDLIDPAPGWVIGEALDLNEHDEVVGWARRELPGQTAEFRGFKLGLPALPSLTQIACAAGPGSPGCAVPAGDIVPFVLGIATDSQVRTKVIFDYVTSVPSTTIPYGPENRLSDQTGVLANPPEWPPREFFATQHAPFVATLAETQLTWSLKTHNARATAQSPLLPTTTQSDGTRVATLPDGRKVNLDSVPPRDPTPQAESVETNTYVGTLSGSLSVSPSGAAIYTVPIALPPGIAGMVPNLSLVYNSQGGDGIAGQGWDLAGLSFIHRCPKTRVQDGAARPVRTNPMTDSEKDGICLDGKRLFERSPGVFEPESKDFSSITANSDYSTFT